MPAAPRRSVLLVVVVLALALVAACSSDGSDDATTTTTGVDVVVPGEHASYAPSSCPDPLLEGTPQVTLDGFECGTLTVPADRRDPDGPTLDLLVGVAKATSATPQPDPIVYLVGGPGGPGMLIGPALVGEGWNTDRDLIVVNQRGTRFTEPSGVCPELDAFVAGLIGEAMTDPAVARRKVDAVAACRDTLAAGGADPSTYGSVAAAADLADLRVAMGIDQWNVVGSSYGTDLALHYLRADPAGIRAVVLDSVIPPQVSLVGSRWRSLGIATDAVFTACEAQPACQRAYPDLRDEFARLLVDLTAEPRHVQATDPASGEAVEVVLDSYALLNVLTVAASGPDGFVPVPAMIHELATGGGQRAADYALSAQGLPPGYSGYGLFYGVVCGEYAPATSAEELAAAAEEAFPGVPDALTALVPNLASTFAECDRWDVAPAPDAVRDPVTSDVPVLMLSGSFDTQTPAVYAEVAGETLSHAIHRTIPGAGHVVALGYPCAHSMLMSFLDDPAAMDDSCLASVAITPFAVPS